MKNLFFLFFLGLTVSGAFAQQIEEIRSQVRDINSYHQYQTKTLEGDEFLDGAPDRGASLTGYYKNGELVKIVEWIGVSNCVNITEFYYFHGKIIFISNSGKSWPYNDKKGDFDYDSTRLTVQSRYYFTDGHLVQFIRDSASECHNMASEADTSDLLKTSQRYVNLLGDCSPNNGTGKLIPIDYTDTVFEKDVQEYTHDTITKNKWGIKYFVKDDCKKAEDIYIEWSSGEKKNIMELTDVLRIHAYLIPQYDSENDSFIYMTSECEQGCAGQLYVLSKRDSTYNWYHDVADYNATLGELVYIPESSYKQGKDAFQVVAVNLFKHQEKTVTFNYQCPFVSGKASCLDIHFKKNKIIVSAILTDKAHPDKDVDETRVVTF